MDRTIKTKVVGVTMLNDDGHSRQELIRDFVQSDDVLILERETDNPVDQNAIAIYASPIETIDYDDKIGYISAELATKLAPLMDSGYQIVCQVLDVTGGEEGISLGVNIQLTIYAPAEVKAHRDNKAKPSEDQGSFQKGPSMSAEQPKRKLFSVRNIIIGSGIILVLCCIVVVILTQLFPSETDTGPETQIVALQTEEIPAERTETPAPSHTTEPTDTPAATDTPRPTNTPTPPPEPIAFSGQGDSIVDLDKWPGAALIKFDYSGSGNFIVWSYDADGNQLDLLVNTIGKYQGTRPIEFLESSEPVTRFAVESSGQWRITVLPLAMVRKEAIPGTITGTGDDVIFLDGANPDLLIADASQAEANFIVYTYGSQADLLINEIAPYTGTFPLRVDTWIIEVVATGPWSLEITTR